MKKIIGGVCLLIFVGSVVLGWRVAVSVQNVSEQWYVPTKQEEDKIEAAKPFSLLLLGVDELDSGRSDTMMVLTVNPQQESTKLVSIPRDTYVNLASLHKYDKINHAYAFGGMELARETVAAFLQIPIDYVTAVDMEAFTQLIDLVGPIEVDNAFAFQYDEAVFPVGSIELDGADALKYVRMRYEDPEGDFGRQERQRAVVEAVIRQAVSWQSVTKYEQVLKLVGEYVQMNLTWQDVLAIAKHYRTSFMQMEQLSLAAGEGMRLADIYYYKVDEEALRTVQQQLQQHLQK